MCLRVHKRNFCGNGLEKVVNLMSMRFKIVLESSTDLAIESPNPIQKLQIHALDCERVGKGIFSIRAVLQSFMQNFHSSDTCNVQQCSHSSPDLSKIPRFV